MLVCLCLGAGNTPAHYSCKGRKPECLNCCVRHVASLDITNILNDTPFDTAKKAGCLSVMIKASMFIFVLHPQNTCVYLLSNKYTNFSVSICRIGILVIDFMIYSRLFSKECA